MTAAERARQTKEQEEKAGAFAHGQANEEALAQSKEIEKRDKLAKMLQDAEGELEKASATLAADPANVEFKAAVHMLEGTCLGLKKSFASSDYRKAAVGGDKARSGFLSGGPKN